MSTLHWLAVLAFAGAGAALLAWAALVMSQIDQDLRDFAGFAGLSFDIRGPDPFDLPFRSPSIHQGLT
jgi:hypothetical protein